MANKKKVLIKKEIAPVFDGSLLDEEGYPTEAVLDYIKNFDCVKYGYLALANFIEQIWWMSDWGYKRKGSKLYLSTGGWSGNEDIIGALEQNHLWWFFCFFQHKRGGHYIFEIKEIETHSKEDFLKSFIKTNEGKESLNFYVPKDFWDVEMGDKT